MPRHRPVLMVFEDAHWIDPTSREVLDLSVDRVRRLPVLLAITFRPEFRAPWSDRSYVTNLTLNRLGERDGEALVHKLARIATLTAEIIAEIVERTDGVPLFVEELTKAVLENAGQKDRATAPDLTKEQRVAGERPPSLLAEQGRTAQSSVASARYQWFESGSLLREGSREPDCDPDWWARSHAGMRGAAPHHSWPLSGEYHSGKAGC
jgi:hypothetical protein